MSTQEQWNLLIDKAEFLQATIKRRSLIFEDDLDPLVGRCTMLLAKVGEIFTEWAPSQVKTSAISKSVRKWDPRIVDAYKTGQEIVNEIHETVMLAFTIDQRRMMENHALQVRDLGHEMRDLKWELREFKEQLKVKERGNENPLILATDTSFIPVYHGDEGSETLSVNSSADQQVTAFQENHNKDEKGTPRPVQDPDGIFTASIVDPIEPPGPDIDARCIIDLASEIDIISRNFAGIKDFLSHRQEILKPRERPGRGGELTVSREEISLKWQPKGTKKHVTTDFAVADGDDFDILLGQTYVNIPDLFEDLDAAYPIRLPKFPKTRDQKADEAKKREESKKANEDQHERLRQADRLERQLKQMSGASQALEPGSGTVSRGSIAANPGTVGEVEANPDDANMRASSAAVPGGPSASQALEPESGTVSRGSMAATSNTVGAMNADLDDTNMRASSAAALGVLSAPNLNS